MINNLIKKRLLIIGSNGMLGQRLVEYFSADNSFELLAASVENKSFFDKLNYRTLDITDKSAVKKITKEFYPDYIINSAAYTNVDGCESEKELAWKINVTGPEHLAFYASTINAHFIHISSDYVFDGKAGPYSETDKVNPISYYGKSKLASENILHKTGGKYTIIRPNVLYGPAKYGRNDFVKWVITSLRNGKQIRIVDDQFNNPTYIDNLVLAISSIINFNKTGLYHIGGKELLNRFDFTMRIADYFNLDKSLVSRIKTEELNQAANRPLKSGLVTLKAETELSYKPFSIEETFSLMQKELNL